MTVHYIEMASWKVDAILICSVLTLFIGIVLMIYLAVIVRASKLPVWPSFQFSKPTIPLAEKKKPGRPKKAVTEQLKQDPIVQTVKDLGKRKISAKALREKTTHIKLTRQEKPEEWTNELDITKED